MTQLNIQSIHQKAMLAYISVSAWSARKLDRKATKSITDSSGATSDAARVNKHLLASSDSSLRDIIKLGNDARRYLEANSLPWDDAGNRLLSNEKALEVVATISGMEKEFSEAVDKFIVEYPLLRAQALANLGDMADNNDYPLPDVVRDKFALRLSLSPLPEGFGDIRSGLAANQIEALEAHFQARVRTQYSTAIGDAWKRLRADVEKISERLTPDDKGEQKVFRNSLIDNARETCALLKSLNVFDDNDLDIIRFQVEEYLCKASSDQLRSSREVSNTVKENADALLERMRDILGE